MKILNLYAGVGGNRKLWSSEHEITAINCALNQPNNSGSYGTLFDV